MNKVIVLIDFDNHFDFDQLKYSSEIFEYSFKNILNVCKEEFRDFEFIEFRLYGGWYWKDVFNKASIKYFLFKSLYNVI